MLEAGSLYINIHTYIHTHTHTDTHMLPVCVCVSVVCVSLNGACVCVCVCRLGGPLHACPNPPPPAQTTGLIELATASRTLPLPPRPSHHPPPFLPISSSLGSKYSLGRFLPLYGNLRVCTPGGRGRGRGEGGAGDAWGQSL